MIYLLMTTCIINNYIHLDKLIDLYREELTKKKEQILFANRNNRRRPVMSIKLGISNDKSNPDSNVVQNINPKNIDKNQIKVLHINDRIIEYKESLKNNICYVSDKINPIIIENNGRRDTFLDDFGIDVHYTENNKESFMHKGINELMDIKSAISAYDIKDDDIIIKLTGRYKLMDDSFLTTVIENVESYDVFIKFFNVLTEEFAENDCILGLFAMRCKYLKDFEYDPKVEVPETQFAEYVRKSECRIYEMERLGLLCKFSDTNKIIEV